MTESLRNFQSSGQSARGPSSRLRKPAEAFLEEVGSVLATGGASLSGSMAACETWRKGVTAERRKEVTAELRKFMDSGRSRHKPIPQEKVFYEKDIDNEMISSEIGAECKNVIAIDNHHVALERRVCVAVAGHSRFALSVDHLDTFTIALPRP